MAQRSILSRVKSASLEFLGVGPAIMDDQRGDDDVLSPNRLASPEDPKASAALNEMISRSGETGWLPASWLDIIATNSDSVLQRAGQDLKLYEVLLDDDVAFSALQQRRLAITARNWEVTPGDDKDPRSVKAADDFRNDIKAVGFDRLTGSLHYGVWFGYAVAEALWETVVDDGRTRIKLADVVVPDRRYFGFTTTGELRAIGFLGATIAGEELPANKFLAIRTGGTHDFAFYGLGLAHWAYWPIFFKRAALKFWALYLEKLGNPTVAVEFAAQDKDDDVQKGKLLQAAVAVGKDSAVLLPEGTLDKRLQILEPTRNASGGSSYQDFVNTQDDALTRVILGQTGTSRRMSTGLGSNQSDVHKEVRDEIVKADADLICEGINSTFPKWLTLWNYGPDVAPPRIYRVLDDAEDLSNVAQRDVQLAGIGIKRTENSVKDVYGDGYVLAETLPKASAKQIAAALGGEIDPETGTVIPNAPPAAPANNAKAFAAEFGIQDKTPLCVSRKLLNGGDLVKWAKDAGLDPVPADEMHATVLYSKTPVDWFDMGDDWSGPDGTLDVGEGGPRTVEQFGKEGADDRPAVLRFASASMRYRHESMRERGASSDYDEFKPHVTVAAKVADGVDLSKIKPYSGPLHFGPEIFKPIRDKATGSAFMAEGDRLFTAADDEAIDRLIAQLCEDADPVFEAMGDAIRKSLVGVKTVEAARVAILGAVETLPIERLARLTGLPMLAERAAASIGVDDLVTA